MKMILSSNVLLLSFANEKNCESYLESNKITFPQQGKNSF